VAAHRMIAGRRFVAPIMAVAILVVSAPSAIAQRSLSDVLSFLLTNRSIPTDDFARDEQAAAATRDTISRFLLLELTRLPVSSSAGGFTYRLNPRLGTVERSSDSFGPFFTERALTAGARHGSFGVNYQIANFTSIDGRNLRDGTLVATASKFRDQSQPFDVETLSLRARASMATFVANYGVLDHLDVGVAVPFVTLSLSGERTDTYRGRQFPQATASASASGMGDIAIRAKYHLVRTGAGGIAVGAEVRTPTGRSEDLLGAGTAALQSLMIGSFDRGAVAWDMNLGYTIGGLSDELDYRGALTVVGAPRLTWIAELAGRRVNGLGTLTDTVSPHPTIPGVDTIRLTSLPHAAGQAAAIAGFKWNPATTWLVSFYVVRALATAGLNARWVPTVSVEYSLGR
jgi:hypothetical protein